MFKAIRVAVLLVVLLVVSLGSWLTRARSTDWNDSLWVKIYPINADGSAASADYIETLDVAAFAAVEEFMAREAGKYGRGPEKPVRMELGEPVAEQPPGIVPAPGVARIMLWSLEMRWWANRIARGQDEVAPDVRIFVRYHEPRDERQLENSVGLQKGMVGVVNAFAGKRHAAVNNVIIAHEFLHTLGATDKYEVTSGLPRFPGGYAEPERVPAVPQQYAEIMGGRIPLTESDATVPESLRQVVIGDETAYEIRLVGR